MNENIDQYCIQTDSFTAGEQDYKWQENGKGK
jgi:hypothetical protein